MINLQKGGIYKHERYGLLEYQRVDTFYGQRTLEFKQVSNGKARYLSHEEVGKMCSQQGAIETVKPHCETVPAMPGLGGVKVIKDDYLPPMTMVVSAELFEVLRAETMDGST